MLLIRLLVVLWQIFPVNRIQHHANIWVSLLDLSRIGCSWPFSLLLTRLHNLFCQYIDIIYQRFNTASLGHASSWPLYSFGWYWSNLRLLCFIILLLLRRIIVQDAVKIIIILRASAIRPLGRSNRRPTTIIILPPELINLLKRLRVPHLLIIINHCYQLIALDINHNFFFTTQIIAFSRYLFY